MQTLISSSLLTRVIFVCALLLTVTTTLPQEAKAFVLDAVPSTLNSNIAMKHTASVSVTWNLTLLANAGPIVSSSQGVFRTPTGQTLGTVNIPLTANVLNNAASVSFKESLLIPASIMAKAQGLGASQILFQRVFTDANSSIGLPLGSLTLNITGSAGAGFSISREALSFTDK